MFLYQAPRNVVHFIVNESSIHVKWDLPKRMDGIKVFVVRAIDSYLRTIKDDGERLCLADKYHTECTLTGLRSSTTYLVTVKSCDGINTDNAVICSRDVNFYERTPDHGE